MDQDTQQIYEDAPCGYISTLLDGAIVRVNNTFLNWTGYAREDLVSQKRLQDLLTAPSKIFYETQLAPLLEMQGSVKEVALDLVCKGRSPLAVLVNSSKQGDHNCGTAYIRSTFFDATDRRRYERELLQARRELEEEVKIRTHELEREVLERKQAEEGLRELTSKLLKLRDDERRRLARELHDSVGQLLAILTMNVSKIQAEASNLSESAASAASESIECVSQISSEIRTISHLLHPPLLDELGLRSALMLYVEGLSTRSGIETTLELAPDLNRLPGDLELAVFRIVQECLTNVHRHSGSKTAAIRVFISPEAVRLEVQDRGKGIPPEKLQELRSFGSGVGLRGMRERVRQLGGTLDLISDTEGTIVVTNLPI